jgi:histidyl-tRNA synthetase
MILEHEIPKGSKVYFGKIAKRKRELENLSANLLSENGFTEIVTPTFSYHQTSSLPLKNLVQLTDHENNPMTLRADNTTSLFHITQKRLGRNSSNTKWFYVQPVFRYPSSESYQIGAEIIDETDLEEVLNLNLEIFKNFRLEPTLQISNIEIPRLIAKNLNIDISLFKNIEIKKILDLKIDWLSELMYLENAEDIPKVKSLLPDFLIEPMEKIEKLVKNIEHKKMIISPIQYTKMEYYNSIYFRVFHRNTVFSRGGSYTLDEVNSVGFSIHLDEVLGEENDL